MTKKILIVDDDAATRFIIRQVVSAGDYDITEAADGRKALDHLERHVPDLVMLDWLLPGVPGVDVLTYLHTSARHTATRIIVITAQERFNRAVLRPTDHLLFKPMSINEIRDAINAMMTSR